MAHVRPQSTVDSALRASDEGVADAVNAAAHGVAVKTIRRWRRDYQRRGLLRGQMHTSVPCPRCEGTDLNTGAYSELLGWYLGDGYISRGRRDVFNLHIYNDEQYPELNQHIFELLSAVKPGGRPHRRKLPGCLVTTVSWKHWPCLFPQHGPGRKHERRIVLESWQDEIVRAHPGDFLRGLFHSDGSRVNNWATPPLRPGRTHPWRHVGAGPRRSVAGTGPPERGTSGGADPGRRGLATAGRHAMRGRRNATARQRVLSHDGRPARPR